MAGSGKDRRESLSVAKVEGASWVASFLLLCFFLRDSLFWGDFSLSHDNFYWVYPIYHFLGSNLAHFSFPLWNPYSHGGEPFYLIPGQIRLYEPLVYPIVFAAKALGMDTVQAFVWNRVLGSLVMCLGAALSLREVARSKVTRALLPPVLLLSSFTFASFQQDGLYSQFVWMPYVYWYFEKIFRKGENQARVWLPFAAVVGVNSISYFFGGTWLFLLALLCAYAIFERPALAAVLRQRATRGNVLLFLAVNLVMVGPSVLIYLERDAYVFPPRMLSPALIGRTNGGPLNKEGGPEDIVPPIPMSFEMVKSTGTFSNLWDFTNSLYLRGSPYLLYAEENWSGKSSEALFYLGIPVWILGLLGLVFGAHRLRRVWLFLLATFSLFALGPAGGLLPALYYVCPPLWFVRHTHTLFLLVHFFFLFFFVLGTDWLLELDWSGLDRAPGRLAKTAAASLALGLAGFLIFRRLNEPVHLSPFLLLAGLAVLGGIAWGLRRFTRDVAFVVPGVLLGQAALILADVKNPRMFLEDLACFLALPLLASILLHARGKRWFLAPVFLAVPMNLGAALSWVALLYAFCPSPRLSHGLDTHFPGITAPYLRHAAPSLAVDGHYQSIRYPELLEGKAYAFSNLYYWHETQATIDGMFPRGAMSPEAFDVARRDDRWSTFLLLRSYFDLIHSPLSADVLRSFFAVGSPLFSFREAAVSLQPAEWPAFFGRLGDPKAVEFAERFVMAGSGEGEAPEAALAAPRQELRFSATLVSYAANSTVVKVRSGRAGLLYWADGYDPRWRATIDGAPTPIRKVNGNFKAVALPEGEHVFEFRYEPVAFEVLLALYYLCFLFGLAAALAPWPEKNGNAA